MTDKARTLTARYTAGFTNHKMVNSAVVMPIGYIKKSDDGDKHQSNEVIGSWGGSTTLSACDYKAPKQVAIPVLTPDRAEKRQNGRRFKEDGEPAFTLTAEDRHGVAVKVKEATVKGYAECRIGGGGCSQSGFP